MKKRLVFALTLMAMFISSCTFLKKTTFFKKDECEILAKKRVVKRIGRQPKIKTFASHAHSTKARTGRTQEAVKVTTEIDPRYTAALSPQIARAPDVLVGKTELLRTNEPFAVIQECNQVQIVGKINVSSEVGSTPAIETSSSEYGFFGLAALVSMGAIGVFKRLSMRVSAWAHRNPATARTMIAGVQSTAFVASYTFGYTLAAEGLKLSPAGALAAGGITALAAIGSCIQKINLATFSRDYLRHKTVHIAIFTGLMATASYVGNSHYTARHHAVDFAGYSMPLPSIHRTESELRQIDNSYVAKQDPPKKKKIGWRILAITLFVAATLFVTAGVCALSCEGYTAGAILLGIGLETALILLLNHVLRSLDGNTKRQKANRDASTAPAST